MIYKKKLKQYNHYYRVVPPISVAVLVAVDTVSVGLVELAVGLVELDESLPLLQLKE